MPVAPSFPVFRSDPADVCEHGGRYRFAPGKRCNRLPLLDRVHGIFAVMDQATQERHAASLGARLATHAEIEQIAKQSYWVSPVIVRETKEETAERVQRGGTNPLERMATEEWCRRHFAGVEAQLSGWDGDKPIMNAGKHWEQRTDADKARGVAVNAGWDTDPRVDVTKWIQNPGRAHNAGPEGKGHVDYSQTALYVWDEDKPSDVRSYPTEGAVPAVVAPLFVATAKAEADAEKYMADALTPATKDEIFAALSSCAPELSRAGVLVLLSQYCLETGAGRSMHRWNLGNFKHVKGDGRAWTMFACSEVLGGKVQWFYPPHPQTWFRAYETLAEGARDYVASMRRNFSKSWPTVVAGDIRAFGHALKLQRYYTADETAYTNALAQWFDTLDLTVGFDVAGALKTLGYPDVKSFQKAANLVVDGIAGRNTITALKSALARLQRPKP